MRGEAGAGAPINSIYGYLSLIVTISGWGVHLIEALGYGGKIEFSFSRGLIEASEPQAFQPQGPKHD